MRFTFILISINLFAVSSIAVPSDTVRKANSIPAIPETLPYYFTKKPFISPKIIEDLSTWISDGGDQVVAINLTESQESNRYFGDIESRDIANSFPYVYVQDKEKGSYQWPIEFGYQYIGQTSNGIYILHTRNQSGGAGIFHYLLLVDIERDTGLSEGDETHSLHKRERILIRKVGEIGLHDRWHGELKLEGDRLYIGPNENEGPGYDSGRWIDIVKP